ncbi:MAG: PAC2 family protein [Candidatus Desulfacyla sp.]
MREQGIEIKEMPKLKNPLFIAGFEGWGNALNVSEGMASFLIRKLDAKCFATVNPDLFYRYDKSRPFVDIKEGILKEISPPGGAFYVAEARSCGRDIVLLKSEEPHLRWGYFMDILFSLCQDLCVESIFTIGSMYDNVLHSDRIVSGIASDETLFAHIQQKQVIPINYQGQSAIHSTIHVEAQKRGFQSLSLWCHCPYYLEGAVHFGLLAHLGNLLSFFGGFELDTQEMETEWKKLNRQIQELIDGNPELQTMVSEIRKAKARASWTGMTGTMTKNEKVIKLDDYINSR